MDFNHTDERILKMYRQGLTVAQMARRLGRVDAQGYSRIWSTLSRFDRVEKDGTMKLYKGMEE